MIFKAGTPPVLSSGLLGISEYFENLYNHHFQDKKTSKLEKIKKINILIADHEEKIGNKFLDFLKTKKKINLIGQDTMHDRNRAPTFSFTVDGITSKEVSRLLVKEGIATRNDNFYAWRCLKALGIDIEDGVVRTSMVHYNNFDDVEKLIKSIDKIT